MDVEIAMAARRVALRDVETTKFIVKFFGWVYSVQLVTNLIHHNFLDVPNCCELIKAHWGSAMKDFV